MQNLILILNRYNYKNNESFIKYLLTFRILLFVLILTPILIVAKGVKKNKSAGLKKITVQSDNALLDINNLSTWIHNNGPMDITPQGNSGLVYPKGTGHTAVFTSGLLWGAKVSGDPDPRVGGTAYRTGLVPGNVDSQGIATDPANARIYRVRPDVYPGGPIVDLSLDATNEGLTEPNLRAKYEQDWIEWPADLGAPYDDKDNNGIYNPTIDIPGVPGAGQTIWYVANDLDPAYTAFLYGASPLGIELQVTLWAYKRNDALGNMYFKKYKLINVTDRNALTPTTFEDMYVSQWADVDLGDPTDDFVGVDTSLGLQYSYNASNFDNMYYPGPPPAVGYTFLNINSTAAYYFTGGDTNLGDPPQGTIDGSRQFYNFFQGKLGISGVNFTDLATGQPTTFALNGDPLANSGWIDGIQIPPGDRRSGLVSGPFNLAPGQTKEIIIAEIVAIGKDNIHSIKLLKYYQSQAKTLYSNSFAIANIPIPPSPSISISVEGAYIKLDWSNNTILENYQQDGFEFEGYNIYQLNCPIPTKENVQLIATFDKINGVKKLYGTIMDQATGLPIYGIQQNGNDNGIEHSTVISSDWLTNMPFIKGKEYFYAISSYAYNTNTNSPFSNSESNLVPLSILYHSTDPGYNYKDSITVTNVNGSEGPIVTIADPSKVTGHEYQFFFEDITFAQTSDGQWHLQSSLPTGTVVVSTFTEKNTWGLIDLTMNKRVLKNQTVYGGEDWYYGIGPGGSSDPNLHGYLPPDYSVIVDGLAVSMSNITINAPNTFFSAKQTAPVGANNLKLWGDATLFGQGTGRTFYGDTTGATQEDLSQDIEFRFTGVPSDPNNPMESTIVSGGSIATIYNRNRVETLATRVRIPFELWEVERNKQINVWIISYNADRKAPWDNATGIPSFYRMSGRDYIIPYPTAYNENATPNDVGITGTQSTWLLFFKQSGVSIWNTGDKFLIRYNNPFNFSLPYTFQTERLVGFLAQQQITDVISTLGQISSVNIKFTKPIADAIKHIEKGLDDKYWLDENHLNLKKGKKVFDENKKAVKKLMHILKEKDVIQSTKYEVADINNSIKDEVTNIIKSLLLVFKDITEVQISDAEAICNNDSKCLKEIEKANKKMTKAAVEIEKGKFDKAIENYSKAWKRAAKLEEKSQLSKKSTSNVIPKEFSLRQNYPNPFNPTTTIRFVLPKALFVTLKIYNMLGQEVKTLLNMEMNAGRYNVQWRGDNDYGNKVASGTYIYRVIAGKNMVAKKMILLK